MMIFYDFYVATTKPSTFESVANFRDDRLKVDDEKFLYGGCNILVYVASRALVNRLRMA